MQKLKPKQELKNLIKLALAEDIGSGDITTEAIIPAGRQAKAVIAAKEAGVIAGLEIAGEVFRQVAPSLKFMAKVSDGAEVKKGKIIAEVSGPARGVLTGERVALNFLQHLSGIATLARKFKIQTSKSKTKVILLDTRKTIPGMRELEKFAVKLGGGENHRLGLWDAILIKDNHIKIAGGIQQAIRGLGRRVRAKGVEIETKNLKEVKEALEAGVERILLDNMSLAAMRKAVKLCQAFGVKTEASGGVNLRNIAAIAKTGVDYISVGALTHSAPAVDISLKIL